MLPLLQHSSAICSVACDMTEGKGSNQPAHVVGEDGGIVQKSVVQLLNKANSVPGQCMKDLQVSLASARSNLQCRVLQCPFVGRRRDLIRYPSMQAANARVRAQTDSI